MWSQPVLTHELNIFFYVVKDDLQPRIRSTVEEGNIQSKHSEYLRLKL